MRTEHDPIEQVRVRILEKKLGSEDDLKKIDARGARHRQRGGRIRHQRSRAGCRRALDRRVPLMPSCRHHPGLSGVRRRGRELDRGRGVLRAHAARDLRRPPADVARDRRLAVRDVADQGRGRGRRRATSTRRWSRSSPACWSASRRSRPRPIFIVSRSKRPNNAGRSTDARAVAHDGEGQPRQVGEERGRQGQGRRRDRRDRDRQGDDGGRGGRRRHARQDSGAGRHRRRRGEHADRRDPERRRGRRRHQGGGSAAPRSRRPPSRAPPAERRRRRSRKRPRRRAQVRRRARRRGAARARRAGRHRDGHDDHARGLARRHGGGDAARRRRVRDGRGGRRVSGRLQGHAGAAAGVRRASA